MFDISVGEHVAVITPTDSEDPFSFRRSLLEATLVHKLTVIDLRLLPDIEPALVAAINSALIRMPGREGQLVVANSRPRVAEVLRSHAPQLLLLANDEPVLTPEPA